MYSHSTPPTANLPTASWTYDSETTVFEVRGIVPDRATNETRNVVLASHSDAVVYASASGMIDPKIYHWLGGEVVLIEDATEYIHFPGATISIGGQR